MNLKNILKIYALERQLNPDDIALLETLRGLNDAERESLVVALQPEKTATKRASKKSSKPASKSAHAQLLSSVIQRTPKLKADAEAVHEETVCVYRYPKDGPINAGQLCSMEESFAVHDERMGYAGYHEFQSSTVAHEASAGG